MAAPWNVKGHETDEEEKDAFKKKRLQCEIRVKQGAGHRLGVGVCQRIIRLIYSRFAHPDNWIKGLIGTSGQPKFR